eukprot:11341133-Ditylum_brightwellii.AAC.1
MDPASQPHGTQPNNEYEDQFIWDTDAEEPNNSFLEDLDMEAPNGAGEKWKTSDSIPIQSKVSRNAVQLNTQASNDEEKSNKGLMNERGK